MIHVRDNKTGLRKLWETYGTELKGGWFSLSQHPWNPHPSDKHMTITIQQLIGGKRWSIALVRIRKDVNE